MAHWRQSAIAAAAAALWKCARVLVAHMYVCVDICKESVRLLPQPRLYIYCRPLLPVGYLARVWPPLRHTYTPAYKVACVRVCMHIAALIKILLAIINSFGQPWQWVGYRFLRRATHTQHARIPGLRHTFHSSLWLDNILNYLLRTISSYLPSGVALLVRWWAVPQYMWNNFR